MSHLSFLCDEGLKGSEAAETREASAIAFDVWEKSW